MDNKKKGDILTIMIIVIIVGFLLAVLGVNIDEDTVTIIGGVVFSLGIISIMIASFFKPFR